MRYRFIAAEKAHYAVEELCRVLGVARSGYYAWRGRRLSTRRCQDHWLLAQIRACFHDSRGCYGSPRIYRDLRARGVRVGRHRVARLMRVHGIQRDCRRRRPPRSVAPPDVVAANALQRAFTAARPNHKWAGDITFVRTRAGWLYVAVLMDLYSRRIIGWAMEDHLTAELTSQALEMALHQRGVPTGLLHHSDRGCPYGASPYQHRLAALGIQGSMSRPGQCLDNAVVESFFASLKVELIHRRDYHSRAEAKADIFEYLEVFYNRHRRHSTLGHVSPVEFERQAGNPEQSVHGIGASPSLLE